MIGPPYLYVCGHRHWTRAAAFACRLRQAAASADYTADGQVAREDDAENCDIDVTQEMIEAGWCVLVTSGIANDPLEADKLLVEVIYRAMERCRRSGSPLKPR